MFNFKKKKLLKNGAQAPEPKPPREMSAIQEECSKLLHRAGQKQFEVDVLKMDIRELNTKILRLHEEANRRNEIDNLAKKDAASAQVASISEGQANDCQAV